MAATPTQCMSCGRAFNLSAPDAQLWNAVYVQGRNQGALCPDCQTPEENAEAERNLEEFDYGSLRDMTDARAINHTELVRVNQKAVLADEMAFTDEALAMFEDDARHLVVLTPVAWDGRVMAAVILDASGEGNRRTGWVAIDAADWMGWEQVFTNADLQPYVDEQARAYIAGAAAGGE